MGDHLLGPHRSGPRRRRRCDLDGGSSAMNEWVTRVESVQGLGPDVELILHTSESANLVKAFNW